MIHETARGDDLTEARHESFILSHLVGGVLALLAGFSYALWALPPDPIIVAALLWLAAPAALALLLARTGRLALCHLLSAVALAGLVGGVAAVTGGPASFAIAWIIVVPAEAALSGSRTVIGTAIVLSVATVSTLGVLDSGELLPTLYRFDDISLVPLLGIVSALGYAGGLALSVQDLNRRAMAAVRRSEDRYRLLAENATDLITRHDEFGNVVDVSGAAATLLGDDGQTAMGRAFLDFIHLADRPAVLTTLTNAARTGRPATVEFRLGRLGSQGGKGRYRWVEMRCRRLAGMSRGIGVVAVTRDITLFKEQQHAVLKARDEAERANTAKSHFLAKISHELRTPLNAIIGFSEILKQELGELGGHDQRVDFAGLIQESGTHLLGVVNDLMDMSRLDVGKLEVNPAPFDLRQTAETCTRVMMPAAESGQVRVDLDLPEPEFEIVADQRACRQILINLLSNAIKFTPARGHVTVRVRSEAGMAVMQVEDTGIGIPAEALSNIGNPFYQVDNGLDRRHEGTGLGLSVVKGLVELHGGSFTIESEPGKGTCVTIRLPMEVPEATPAMPEASASRKIA